MHRPVSLPPRDRLPLHRRPLPLLAVAAAYVLSKARPKRIRTVLELARHGAKPATVAEARRARDAVMAVSMRCAGQRCLQRSIAAALLCRAHGAWPTWCTGIRTHPFAAHAWIEAEGRLIGEPYPPGHYRPLITVAPD